MTLNDFSIKLTKHLALLMIAVMIFMSVNIAEGYVFAQNMTKEHGFPNANKAKDEEPITLGTSACLIDAKSGYMIYGVDEHEENYPASTTKILTGLLAVENLDLDQLVTVDKEAMEQGGSQLYLTDGEQMTVDGLMYGMMLPSANDAALALAKAMGETTEGFAEMMNKRAEEAGALNSNFVNPNGLPDDNHFTSAYDLAYISKEAMKNEDFRRYVSTYEYTIPKTNFFDARLVHNRNRLLYNLNRKVEAYGETKSIKYDGVTGIKTGYTEKAKFCLVGSAERNGTELIAVTMKSEDMNGYQDVISMLDYGFNNYKTEEIMKKGEIIDDFRVNGGSEKYAKAVVTDGLYVTLPVDADLEDITIEEKYEEISAPYKAGLSGGTIVVYYNEEKVGETKISITEGMEEGSAFDDIFTGSGFWGIASKIIIALLVLGLVILILRAVNDARRRARRRRRRRGYQK